MVRDVDYAPVGLVVIDAKVVASRVAGEEREKVRHVAELAQVNTLFFREGEDGPKRVRISFAHRVHEAHVLGGGGAGGGPEPVAAWHFASIVQRDFGFDRTLSGTQAND